MTSGLFLTWVQMAPIYSPMRPMKINWTEEKKNKPITMLIRKTLSGEVGEMTPKASDDTTTEGVWTANPKHVLTWEVKLTPGGRSAITYRYKAYVRR